jgi:hypothetical protein
MSTSALASARRRRATNENPTVPNTSINTTRGAVQQVQQVQKDIPQVQNQTLTPLQILQIHDIKIKDLETIITEFTDEDLLSKFIDEKIEGLAQSKNDDTKRENISSNVPTLYNEKLQMQEKNIEQKLELQNIKIDEFRTSIRELITNIKEENTNTMNYINTNIQNQITSNANLLNDKIAQKFEKINSIENIMSEFNELKLLVISSQNIALETSNTVNKLYEQCNSNSTRVKAVEDRIALLNSRNNDETSNFMLQSLLGGSLFKSGDFSAFDFKCQAGESCENCEPDEIYDENIDEIKKINIDFGSNELILSEEQFEDLLDIRNSTEDNISIHEIIADDTRTLEETPQSTETDINQDSEPTEDSTITEDPSPIEETKPE